VLLLCAVNSLAHALAASHWADATAVDMNLREHRRNVAAVKRGVATLTARDWLSDDTDVGHASGHTHRVSVFWPLLGPMAMR